MSDDPVDPVDPVDPGGAAERTQLAWGRTGTALVLAGIAVGRGIGERVAAHPVEGAIVAVLGVALAVVTMVTGKRRADAISRGRDAPRIIDLAPFAALACVTGLVVLAIAIARGLDHG